MEIFRIIAIIDYYIEKAIEKLFKKRWKVVGHCNKDGRCCKDIGILVEKWIVKNRYVLKFVMWWYTRVYPFYFKYYIEKEKVLVFGCTKLNGDGSCSIYRKRPPICRRYPIVNYFKKPVLFENCSYRTEINN